MRLLTSNEQYRLVDVGRATYVALCIEVLFRSVEVAPNRCGVLVSLAIQICLQSSSPIILILSKKINNALTELIASMLS